MIVNGEHIGKVSASRAIEISIDGLFSRNKEDLEKAKKLNLGIKLNNDRRAIQIKSSSYIKNIRVISNGHLVAISNSRIGKLELVGECNGLKISGETSIESIKAKKCCGLNISGKCGKIINIGEALLDRCINIRTEYVCINKLKCNTSTDNMEVRFASTIINDCILKADKEIDINVEYTYIKNAELVSKDSIEIKSYEEMDRCVSAVCNMVCNSNAVYYKVGTAGISNCEDKSRGGIYSLEDVIAGINGGLPLYCDIAVDDKKEFRFVANSKGLYIDRTGWIQKLETSANVVIPGIKTDTEDNKLIVKVDDIVPWSVLKHLGKIDVLDCTEYGAIVVCDGDIVDVREAYNITILPVKNNNNDYKIIIREKLEDNIDSDDFEYISSRLENEVILTNEDSEAHKQLIMYGMKFQFITEKNKDENIIRKQNRMAMLGLSDASETIKKISNLNYTSVIRLTNMEIFGNKIKVVREAYDKYLVYSTLGIKTTISKEDINKHKSWWLDTNGLKLTGLDPVDGVREYSELHVKYKGNSIAYKLGKDIYISTSNIEDNIEDVVSILDGIDTFISGEIPILKCGTNYKNEAKRLKELVNTLICLQICGVRTPYGRLLFVGDTKYLIDANGKVTRDEVRVDGFIARYKEQLSDCRDK